MQKTKQSLYLYAICIMSLCIYTVRLNIIYLYSTFRFIAGCFYIAANATDTCGFCSDRLINWVAWCEEFHGILSSL